MHVPYERSGGKRDGVAVLRLVVVNALNTRRCPVGIVNRGFAATGKANQNQEGYKDPWPGGDFISAYRLSRYACAGDIRDDVGVSTLFLRFFS